MRRTQQQPTQSIFQRAVQPPPPPRGFAAAASGPAVGHSIFQRPAAAASATTFQQTPAKPVQQPQIRGSIFQHTPQAAHPSTSSFQRATTSTSAAFSAAPPVAAPIVQRNQPIQHLPLQHPPRGSIFQRAQQPAPAVSSGGVGIFGRPAGEQQPRAPQLRPAMSISMDGSDSPQFLPGGAAPHLGTAGLVSTMQGGGSLAGGSIFARRATAATTTSVAPPVFGSAFGASQHPLGTFSSPAGATSADSTASASVPLTAEDVAAYRAPRFVLGHVPEAPPTPDLC